MGETLKEQQGDTDRNAQREIIVSLLRKGDEDANSGRYHEAILSYYSIFQPGMSRNSRIGLRRVVPIALFDIAASRLKATASICAAQLAERGYFLPDESPVGIVGIPRGALNLYLISNQYDVFTDRALQFAAEEFPQYNVKRFLMSLVRARLNNLRNVQAYAPLFAEEAEAFEKLAFFEKKLHALLIALHCQAKLSYFDTRVKSSSIAAG